jgi:hypothetical protein
MQVFDASGRGLEYFLCDDTDGPLLNSDEDDFGNSVALTARRPRGLEDSEVGGACRRRRLRSGFRF